MTRVDDDGLLDELVAFLHDANPQARAIAVSELLPYTPIREPRHSVFKRDDLRGIKDLKLLVLDQPKTAHDALTALINLSQDVVVRATLVDTLFIESLLAIIVNPQHGLADLACMLLANIAKHDSIESLITMTRKTGSASTSTSDRALNQLMDCFVRGAERQLNPHASYDFLANVFADLTRFPAGRNYFLEEQSYDSVVPISKLVVFTSSKSQVRRTGVVSVIKNCSFEVGRHNALMAEDGINILSYLLTPLCGPDEYDLEENEQMLPELQFLPDDKKREADSFITTVILDTLLLLGSTRQGRDHMRARQVYPITRQLHKANTDEEVAEGCDKLVNILMRDEEEETAAAAVQLDDSSRAVVQAGDSIAETQSGGQMEEC